jgi:NADH-quinone oxidoreductase subunit G
MLEFVLINHPLDCPICDKAGECMLQDQYMEFSGDKSRFNETKVAKEKLFHFSDKILYDAERCITCSRCVRFTATVSKTNKLGIVKRSDNSYVSLAHGDTFDDPYSYCVTDICPVGALTSKKFRFKERVWNLHKTESICAGCSRGCNICIETKDNNVFRVLPSENEKVNKSWMCDFARYFYMEPMKNRTSGTQVDHKNVTYEIIVEETVSLLKEHGSEMVFILSNYATNEELALAKQLIKSAKVKGIFTKYDRVWAKNSDEVKSDDILINEDKTPNMAGVQKVFPSAKDMSELIISDYEYAFVWGPNAAMKKLSGLQLISLSTMKDQVSDKAKWAIAGRFATEKHGSFTNCDGIEQTFRRAIKGEDNYDDFSFFVDVLKGLGVNPIGRTVQEVRKATK